ncbi:MAG: carbohydrate-binding family 9-like protein [Myxococcales bacterium]|nr:carbohydrate-binding family 9-like protein [Myxococcales bacterium]
MVLALAALVGCVDKSPPAPAVDPALVAENLLPAPPADIATRVDATFGDGIVYLGNTVELAHQGPVVPGDKLTIVHYWQVNKAPPKGYRVFSHLQGEQGDYANVDLTDMRKGHPPDTWRAGEVIRDKQTFVLRKDWRSPKGTLVVGLYKKGSPKVTDRLAVTGAPSKDGAVPVATFAIDLSKVPPPPGTVVIKKAGAPLTIDGKADDAAWQTAASTSGFATAEGGPEPKGPTAAKLTWDDEHLYVFVSATDNDVASTYTKTDEPIWKADVVEVFIDADNSGKGYVELQVSPTNVQFDTWYAIGRPNDDKAFAAGMKSAVTVRGTVNAGNLDDEGWDVEIAIPLAAVKGLDPAMNVRLPPQPGDTWHLNVVRVDYPKGGQPAAAAWNRIRYADFHSLDRMLTIQFADIAGGVTPPPAAPAPTAPAPTAPAPTGEAPPPTGPTAPAPGAAPVLTPTSPLPTGATPPSAARVPATAPGTAVPAPKPAPPTPPASTP